MGKVDKMQEKIGSRWTLRKKQNKMLEIKNIIREMKNIFNRFIHRLSTVKKRINKHEDISIETSKTTI